MRTQNCFIMAWFPQIIVLVNLFSGVVAGLTFKDEQHG